MENPSVPCRVCGDLGVTKSIMTCFYCKDVREHTYCARVGLASVPEIWLCEVCRSSTRVLQILKLADDNTNVSTTDHRASTSPEISSKFSEEISKPVLEHGGSRLEPPADGLALLAHTAIEEDKRASSVSSNDASPSKITHRPQFLAFPSPKRKRRSTLRKTPDTEGSQSSCPRVFQPID